MLNTPFSPWPCYSSEEADAVREVVLSNKVNYWTGQLCRLFEQEFADWCGAKYAISLANGTLALEAALKALGIGVGDEVVVTPRTFIASVSCVVNSGATPVFADVERNSGNLSARTIEAVLTPKTKAIICVHLAGWPCDMDPIMALAQQHGLKVVEDCAQAHGARYKGASVGTIGDIGAWSFCQDKIMTTGGEGGMVTTNDPSLWSAMWSWKDHGKSWSAVYEREHPPGFRWVHEGFGTNWRMMEVQAAIGRVQLRRMGMWTVARNRRAEKLAAVCRRHKCVRVPVFPVDDGRSVHACYKYYVYVDPDYLDKGWSRDRIVDKINSLGVPCYQGTCSEVYREQAFLKTGWQPAEPLPVARELGQTSLMFLVHPTLTDIEMDDACRVLDMVLAQATGQSESSR